MVPRVEVTLNVFFVGAPAVVIGDAAGAAATAAFVLLLRVASTGVLGDGTRRAGAMSSRNSAMGGVSAGVAVATERALAETIWCFGVDVASTRAVAGDALGRAVLPE